MNIDQGIKSFWKIISGIKSFQEDYSNDRLVDNFKRNIYKIQFFFSLSLCSIWINNLVALFSLFLHFSSGHYMLSSLTLSQVNVLIF